MDATLTKDEVKQIKEEIDLCALGRPSQVGFSRQGEFIFFRVWMPQPRYSLCVANLNGRFVVLRASGGVLEMFGGEVRWVTDVNKALYWPDLENANEAMKIIETGADFPFPFATK